MPEPTSTSLAAPLSIALLALFPGVDINALIGAFAGATVFVVNAKALSLGKRALYLLISIVMGYLLVPSILQHTPVTEPALAGFSGGLLCISGSLFAIRQIEGGDLSLLSKWFGGKPK